MTEPERRDNKHALIYFDRGNSAAFKELAARVREAKGRTTLIWSSRWSGPADILKEGRAVIIQEGCANAKDICDAYRQYASDVEIHFVDSAGEFLEGETAVETTQEDTPETEKTTEQPESGDDSAANDKSGEDTEASTEADAAVQDDSANEEGADQGSADDGGDDPVESVSDDSVEAGQEAATDPERTSSR